MEWNEKSPRDNFKNTICYIPLIAIGLYFIDEVKSEDYSKNIMYWIYLFVLYVFSSIVIYFFLFYWAILFILFFVYFIMSSYYWYKAYRWDDIDIFIIDELDKKVKSLGK
jgi:hypothetical protein